MLHNQEAEGLYWEGICAGPSKRHCICAFAADYVLVAQKLASTYVLRLRENKQTLSVGCFSSLYSLTHGFPLAEWGM